MYGSHPCSGVLASLSLLHITERSRGSHATPVPRHQSFCGCEQLALLTPLDISCTWKGVNAEDNTFLMCDKFQQAPWLVLLPPKEADSDAFDEELHTELH